MSQRLINPELLGQINRGAFDRRIFAIPGDEITPGTGTGPVGERVQPGDLITADLINLILARLDALENRPVPTVPTVTMPTFPTITFPTFPTGVLTFPTGPVFTIDPTIFTRPTGPVFTLPTGPVLTMGPVFTMGPTGPVLTMGPIFTMPGNIATMAPTGLATMGPGGLATGPGGLGNLGGIGPAGGGVIRREDSVTVLPGIGRDEETRLTNVGITNLGRIADADATTLGTALGVQPAEAARVIGIARGALGPR